MTAVRETMRTLPAAAQPLLTWISGKPLEGQRPLFRSSSSTQTASALLSLYGGAALGFWAVARLPVWAWPVALIPGWLLVSGAARKIQVTLVHQCSHFNYSGDKRLDRVLAQALSTLVLTDHFDAYFHEHIRIHHTKRLGGAEDPDCKFLLKLGFKPGMSKAALWRRLAWTVVSPAYHLGFLAARLRSNFVSAPPRRLAASVVYHAAWLSLIATTGAWKAYLLAWWLPLTLVYHAAALLNFSSLHIWLKDEEPGESAKTRMCSLTSGRFLGDAAPRAGAPALDWARWTARLALVHLPLRVGVLSGDLPVHDYHHRHPQCGDWANFLYTRQRDVERGMPGYGIPYTENWGLFSCIDAVFENLSSLEPEALSSPAEPAMTRAEALAYAVQL